MTNVAVRADGLGKQYRLGDGSGSRYQTLRDTLALAAMRPFRSTTNGNGRGELFWALRDVSFEIRQGEAVGIIGRNGAGKSTLLKILSRITGPTEGRAEIRGNVGSLLEVGTGFHPELTGRENVFLNGAILGMKRAEIARKFDDIVAFAEIEKFIDSPVKVYSSGMYMRLAFAVAAHLDPEILIVDEVLAVGDAAFQKKSLGKMEEVAQGGRTILFVSHNMAAIEALTHRCIYLDRGRIKMFDDTRAAVAAYRAASVPANGDADLDRWTDRRTSGQSRIVKFECTRADGEAAHTFAPREPIRFRVAVRFDEAVTADVSITVEADWEQPLFTTHLSDTQQLRPRSGLVEFEAMLNPNLLRQGRYLVSIAVGKTNWISTIDVVHHFPAFEITGHPDSGHFPLDNRWGPLYLQFDWTSK
jgi:lipopolysaccharide transport system ATP-binding protein